MGDSNVSNVIPQTINLFKLSDYANGLVQIEKDIYLEKLVKVNIDCPYLFPDQMWQTSVTLLETFLPPRKRFGAKWKCKACSALTKKVSKNKENTKVTKSKSKQSVKLVAKRGLSLKN